MTLAVQEAQTDCAYHISCVGVTFLGAIALKGSRLRQVTYVHPEQRAQDFCKKVFQTAVNGLQTGVSKNKLPKSYSPSQTGAHWHCTGPAHSQQLFSSLPLLNCDCSTAFVQPGAKVQMVMQYLTTAAESACLLDVGKHA